jgi:tryptophanase
MKTMYELGIPVPSKKALVVRNFKEVTKEQREKILKETEYNMFTFPADLLILDFLSDSGTTTMSFLMPLEMFLKEEINQKELLILFYPENLTLEH